MKKITALILIIFLSTVNSINATDKNQSTVSNNQSLNSTILNKEVPYSIYLPKSYNDGTKKSYPILYLLHGLGNDHTTWLELGRVKESSDSLMNQGIIDEMIIVMPNGWQTWYVNRYDGTENYEDMFFNEFIPTIESKYRIKSGKETRYIAGLSMGGYGSLVYILHHPEMFGAAIPMSPAVLIDSEFVNGTPFNEMFNEIYGNGILTKHYRANSPLDLINKIDTKNLDVRLMVESGDDDFLFRGIADLYAKLRENNIPVTYIMRKGNHNWDFWKITFPQALKFINNKTNNGK